MNPTKPTETDCYPRRDKDVAPRSLHSLPRWLASCVLLALLALTASALLLVATATVPTLFGYKTYVVRGGSMEPTLSDGTVAVTHPTSVRALDEGDVIAFRLRDGSPAVLHRIVSIDEQAGGARLFTTQGDSNAGADATPVALAGHGDKMVYSVPYAGHILQFAEGALGRFTLIGLPLLLLGVGFVRDRRAGRTRAGPEGSPARGIVTASHVDARPALDAMLVHPAFWTMRAPTAAPADSQDDLPAFLLRQLEAAAEARGETSAGRTSSPIAA